MTSGPTARSGRSHRSPDTGRHLGWTVSAQLVHKTASARYGVPQPGTGDARRVRPPPGGGVPAGGVGPGTTGRGRGVGTAEDGARAAGRAAGGTAVRERRGSADAWGVTVLGACAGWALLTAAGRDARPEGCCSRSSRSPPGTPRAGSPVQCCRWPRPPWAPWRGSGWRWVFPTPPPTPARRAARSRRCHGRAAGAVGGRRLLCRLGGLGAAAPPRAAAPGRRCGRGRRRPGLGGRLPRVCRGAALLAGRRADATPRVGARGSRGRGGGGRRTGLGGGRGRPAGGTGRLGGGAARRVPDPVVAGRGGAGRP